MVRCWQAGTHFKQSFFSGKTLELHGMALNSLDQAWEALENAAPPSGICLLTSAFHPPFRIVSAFFMQRMILTELRQRS
jgi:hypothetical protein